MVHEYNSFMGGVDHVNQQLHNPVNTSLKIVKMVQKLAFQMISQVTLNANKVHKYQVGVNTRFLQFLHDVTTHLVALLPNFKICR